MTTTSVITATITPFSHSIPPFSIESELTRWLDLLDALRRAAHVHTQQAEDLSQRVVEAESHLDSINHLVNDEPSVLPLNQPRQPISRSFSDVDPAWLAQHHTQLDARYHEALRSSLDYQMCHDQVLIVLYQSRLVTTLLGRPILTFDDFLHSVQNHITAIYSQTQALLSTYMEADAAEWCLAQDEDLVQVVGKLDAVNLKVPLLTLMGIESSELSFQLTFSLFRTLCINVELDEVERIFGVWSPATLLWRSLARYPRARSRWLIWVNGLGMETELPVLLRWFNTRSREQVVDAPRLG